MTAALNKVAIRILLALPLLQTACVSHQHKPDPATVVESADCTIVNGDYLVSTEDDGRLLAEFLFGQDGAVAALTIDKSASQIAFTGSTAEGQMLPPTRLNRLSCKDGILKVILKDESSADGIAMVASDRVLELFASEESSLDLRFVGTTLAFVFIVPYYESDDELVTLRRQPVAAE